MRAAPITPSLQRLLAEVDAVFFDAVGTLLHPEPSPAAVYTAAGQRFGTRLEPAAIRSRFTSAFRRQEEIDRTAGLRTGEIRELSRWRAIVAEVLDDVADLDGCFHFLYDHFARPDAWRLDPQAGAVLASLAARGLQLGIASNFDHRLRGIVAGLPPLVPARHLVISSAIGWRKPAKEFFTHLCDGVGLPPHRVLLVGDDLENDHAGARAAGLRSLLLDPRGTAPVPDEERISSLGVLLAGPGSQG